MWDVQAPEHRASFLIRGDQGRIAQRVTDIPHQPRRSCGRAEIPGEQAHAAEAMLVEELPLVWREVRAGKVDDQRSRSLHRTSLTGTL
ncbi:hypothetical protein GCM10008955_38780 [Deinococcus malanensis]|uniref:Uncharacterized protein n=1 Tax=Deinococcus malanensis TaxID=1706855 RepID=A0ABQ2F1W6_9DEIO|nr:hypothetical protein GCM10008955_38780 [Deinococcus malanensis]